MTADLTPGLLVLHSHRLEHLRDVLVQWLQAYPLAPLESEVVLVQSNGMAQWLKAALAADVSPPPGQAAGLGICAGVEVVFPARFLWRAYRDVLGRAAVPETSPYDKSVLVWRILALLPSLLPQEAFAPLRLFLADDADGRRAWQLAGQLADLFDQYQVYRPDWLNDWTEGRDVLACSNGQPPRELPGRERWQPLLWRALAAEGARAGLADGTHRAILHERFLAALARPGRPAGLPRRIIVWGLSTLPRHVLEALAGLGRHVQVILAVVNPCQHYWSDLVQPRERLRHARKPGQPLRMDEDMLTQHANPLLLAWGQQGRDYLRLLEDYDDPAAYRARFDALGQRIDLFDEAPPLTLLQQVQAAVRELEPLPAQPGPAPSASDCSLLFQVAHSRLREVEALHDHLLALLAAQGSGEHPLRAQDIAVMVPDIRDYAPLIEAVFAGDDTRRRTLPFTILDRPQRGTLPLLTRLEWLLQLPEARCTTAEIWDLLDVPAIRERFGLAADQLPRLRHWLEEAGARWGLDADHRAHWQMPAGLGQNTWRFALDRLLLGYATGAGAAFADTLPYGELSALDAAALGPLAALLDALARWRDQLAGARSGDDWTMLLRQLLDDFFLPDEGDESWLLEQVRQALDAWARDIREAACGDRALTLTVVREAWLGRLDEASMSQRFLSGSVHFATLMPMRAIPFRVVCILGLGDGEFPRQRQPADFDLMALAGERRPGDRSRRDDDRYLFLEALLSAREQLLLSWVGRSARSNQLQPPSLLVAQLQDYLRRGWQPPSGQTDLIAGLTRDHALQPFSTRYFDGVSGLFTHAQAWRSALDAEPVPPHQPLPVRIPEQALTLASLLYWLRNPVNAFYRDRLGVHWRNPAEAVPGHEPFAVDGLDRYQASRELLDALQQSDGAEALGRVVSQRQGRGQWPLAGFAAIERQRLDSEAGQLWQQADGWRAGTPVDTPLPGWSGHVAGIALAVSDAVPGLRLAADGSYQLWLLTPSRLLDDKGELRSWHTLLELWLTQVFLAVQGIAASAHALSASGLVHWPALPRAQAESWWQALLTAWLDGQTRAIPCEAKAALAWTLALASKPPRGHEDTPEARRLRAEEVAAQIYEGGSRQRGSGEAPPLAWVYPDFAALAADGEFARLADTLYRPLVAAVLAARRGSEEEGT